MSDWDTRSRADREEDERPFEPPAPLRQTADDPGLPAATAAPGDAPVPSAPRMEEGDGLAVPAPPSTDDGNDLPARPAPSTEGGEGPLGRPAPSMENGDVLPAEPATRVEGGGAPAPHGAGGGGPTPPTTLPPAEETATPEQWPAVSPAPDPWSRPAADGPAAAPGDAWPAAPTPLSSPELPEYVPPQRPTSSATRSRHHSRNPVDRLTRGLPDPVRVVVDWVVTIVGAIAIVLLVKAYVVNPYRIPSSSMEPTLHCAQPASGCEASISDRVLANRFIYHLRDPRRGEIVVFETPRAAQVKCGAGGTFVKRIIGLPGETIEVKLRNGDGYVYINGRKLNEPYVQKDRRGAVDSFGPKKIPAGHYFMMGDNRAQSCDSRQWGAVPRANLIGKVFATYWPPNRLSLH